MITRHFEVVYSVSFLASQAKASAVVYSKDNRHSVLIRESESNTGLSLTNSVEYAVIELSKQLGCHPEHMQVFQLDEIQDVYDLVEFKNGNPYWLTIRTEEIVPMLSSWLGLDEEELKTFT